MPQYQGVWTLEAQAQAQSNQQWVTDPNFKNTTLLLQADGTGSGSQNQTFLDGSTNNFFITRNGNTTQGSFSPFSQAPGYWSNYFTTSDGLSIGTAVTVGNTWTVECWFVVLQTGQTILVNGNGATGDPWIGLSGGTVQISFASVTRSFTAPYSLGVWYHLALTCNAGTVTVYLNGVQQGATQSSPTSNLTINRIAGYNGGGANAWFGYISNLRITNTVVYSSNFTPQTTPLTAISGTALLTCQSNRFVDNSATAAAITINAGTPSVQAYSPLAPALQWTPDVVGGSGYFDGTGDNLATGTAAALNFGTSNFTIECWYYLTGTTNGDQTIMSNAETGYNSTVKLFKLYYAGQSFPFFDLGAGNGSVAASNTSSLINQWNHAAIVRSGNTFTMYLNGVGGTPTTFAGSVNMNSNSNTYIGYFSFSDPNSRYTGYVSGLRAVTSAVYTANFTPPTTPPTAIANTQLLLNMTNAGIYDGAMDNVLETVGNTQVSTSIAKYGSGSIQFDGTGDWILMPQSPTLTAGSGNFTYELWLFPVANNNCIFDTRTVNNTTTGFTLLLNSSNLLSIYTNGTIFNCTVPVTLSAWQHVAVVRSNGILYVYLNGVSIGSAAFTNDLTDKTLRIGSYVGDSGPFTGFIDDFRFSKIARYFTTFTPPQQALPRQ